MEGKQSHSREVKLIFPTENVGETPTPLHSFLINLKNWLKLRWQLMEFQDILINWTVTSHYDHTEFTQDSERPLIWNCRFGSNWILYIFKALDSKMPMNVSGPQASHSHSVVRSASSECQSSQLTSSLLHTHLPVSANRSTHTLDMLNIQVPVNARILWGLRIPTV